MAHPFPVLKARTLRCFPPNGKWVAFFSGIRLLKVNVEQFSPPVLLLEAADDFLDGGQWLADGSIIFSRMRHVVQRVPDTGGVASDLMERRQSPPEIDHHNPVMLPGGDTLLFTLHDSDGRFHVAVETLSTKQRKIVVESAYDARYLSSGHLVFARERTILAAPFSLRSLAITGREVTLIEGVNGDAINGDGGYQLSSNGTLVFNPMPSTSGRTLTWVDRSGAETPLALPPRRYNSPSISPDGRRIAFSIDDGAQRDIYVHDLASGSEVRFTRSGNNQTPIWSRDGNYLTYSAASRSNPLGRTLMREPVDHSRAAQELVSGGIGLVPGAWTLGDERLFFADGTTSPDGIQVNAVDPAAPGQVEVIAAGPGEQRHPSVSPDGRWLAFTSTETVRPEVFVTSVHRGGKPRQLSTDGGRLPKWSQDGREISFRFGPRMMAVAIDPASGAALGRPRPLFEGGYVTGFGTGGLDSDRSPDGRFLMIKPGAEEQTPQPLRVVVNWIAEIRSRVTVPR